MLLCFGATLHQTPTFDEPRHLQMGRQILLEGSWARFDNSKMPVSAFNALPTLISPAWREGSEDATDTPRAWIAPRAVQAGWLLATVLLAAAWARRCFGGPAALVTAALVAFDPNLLAHSGLVTTDAPATFFTLATLYTAWRAVERRSWPAWGLVGATLGLAQAAKFSSIFLLPILGLALPVSIVISRYRRGSWPIKPLGVIVFLLAGWLALNASYGFDGTFTRGSEIPWQSEWMRPMGRVAAPLPFPRPWLEGLDWVRADDEHGSGNIYADGRMTPDGQLDHYLRVVGWKFPLPLLILGVLGLVWPRRRIVDPAPLDLFTTWPIVFLVGWYSLAFNYQIGVRYLLPVVPLLALGIARLPWHLGAVGAAYILISGLSWFPRYLPYQNERLLHRVDAWRHVADSNLDWGQEDALALRWLSDHPDGVVDPDVPAPGPMLVSANRLTGVLGDPARLACLRERHPPRTHLGMVWYPYDLAAMDLVDCFPHLRTSGEPPPLPPGASRYEWLSDGVPHVIVARVRGISALGAGASPPRWHEGAGGAEALIGFVVDAPSGPLPIVTEGHVLGLYVDGRPLPGAPLE